MNPYSGNLICMITCTLIIYHSDLTKGPHRTKAQVWPAADLGYRHAHLNYSGSMHNSTHK